MIPAGCQYVNYTRRGCDGKERYSKRRVAKKVAKVIKMTHHDKLFPYFCALCDRWHLGHCHDRENARRRVLLHAELRRMREEATS